MKLRYGLALVIFVSLILWTACGQTESKTIKIGHAVALTGDASVFGQSEHTGLKIAVEEINRRGGILGKQVELVAADTRADPTETVNAVRRLTEQEKVVAVIGVSQSGVAIAATPVVTAAKVPLISTTSSNPYVTQNKTTGETYKYVFRVCFIDTYQGRVDAEFAYDRLKKRNVGILYDVGSDYSQWLAKYFEEGFTKLGGKIAAKEAYRTGELDFRAPLGKIKQSNPDLIFLPLTQKDAALVAKQVRDLGIKATLLGGDNWGSPDILTLGGAALEGSYFSDLASYDEPNVKKWIVANEKRFGGPVVRNAMMANDAAFVLADAIKRAGSTDGDKIVAALEQTKDLPVLTTDKFTFDGKTHNPLNRPAYFNEIKGGKFVLIETFAAK
jgi:branched-chain amino acid transport system substrate-binding protein